MDILSMWGLLKRHALAATVVAVLTVATVIGVAVLVPRSWQTSASYLLVYPTQSSANSPQSVEAPGNPFLAYGGSSPTVAQALAARVSGDSVRTVIDAQDPGEDYTVATSDALNASGQILYVTVTGRSQKSASRTLSAVASALTDQLRAMQVVLGARPDSLITISPAGVAGEPRQQLTGLVRSVVGVVAAGLVALFAVLAVAEARRGKKREAARGASGAHADKTSV